MSARKKIILIQAGILVALVLFFKVGLPRIERARSAERLAARQQAIGTFFQSATSEVAAGAAAARHIHGSADVADVQRQLGAPDQSMTDFAGAQHLTWVGTNRKILASFNKGQLYALTLSDLAGIHGERVYLNSSQYQRF